MKHRLIGYLLLTATLLFAVAACGQDTSAANGGDTDRSVPSPADSGGSSESAAIDDDGVQATPRADGERAFGGFGGGRLGGFGGGFDASCASDFTGRDIQSADDLTAEERALLSGNCVTRGDFGDRFAFDSECASDALGHEISGFQDMTPDERTTVVAECGGGDFPRFAGGGGFQPPGDGSAPRGGFDGRGGFGGGGGGFALDTPCIEDILGDAITEQSQISPEQRAQIFEKCFQQP